MAGASLCSLSLCVCVTRPVTVTQTRLARFLLCVVCRLSGPKRVLFSGTLAKVAAQLKSSKSAKAMKEAQSSSSPRVAAHENPPAPRGADTQARQTQ